jgi:copper(I)-binding protein
MKGLSSAVLRAATLGIAVFTAVLGTMASATGQLAAENAWVPWAPPAIKVHAAYLTIANRTNVDQFIVGASSPDYERAELHGSFIKDGLNQMRLLERISVPANTQVKFEPGGLHIMLVNPERTYGVDHRIRLVLLTGSGDQIEATAVIRRRERGSGTSHHHHESHR